jgi:hypothetical protein
MCQREIVGSTCVYSNIKIVKICHVKSARAGGREYAQIYGKRKSSNCILVSLHCSSGSCVIQHIQL